jgi:hypothetical protein
MQDWISYQIDTAQTWEEILNQASKL